MYAKSLQSCLTLCDPMDCSLPGSSVHGILPARITGEGYHFLLQGILLTQRSNPCLLQLLHWQTSSLPLRHLGSPRTILWVDVSSLLLTPPRFSWLVVVYRSASSCCETMHASGDYPAWPGSVVSVSGSLTLMGTWTG